MCTPESVDEMRQRLCQAFHRRISDSMTCADKHRKLILHFDVNKTIVAVDSATGETVQDALNVYLSGMAWGKDREGKWEMSKGHLSHSPDESDDVSFYKFEEKRLLCQPSRDRSTFRYHLSSFTDGPHGSNFKPYLNILLHKMKWTLPYEENQHKSLTVPGTESYRYHFILPSFYKLLNHLTEQKRDYSIIFRTYGSDAKNVMKSMRTAIIGAMPFCRNLDSLSENIPETMFILKREENGLFSLSPEGNSTECVNANLLGGNFLKSDEEMYTTLTRTQGICAIRDDVHAWYNNDFQPSKGKPFWVDPSDATAHHIFFDDNIRPGLTDSIVNLRVRNSTECFSDVDRSEEYKFVHQNIVPVVLSEAIMDTDYFVKELAMCELNRRSTQY